MKRMAPSLEVNCTTEIDDARAGGVRAAIGAAKPG
jgi:hypothetical protein